ncbi:MAG: GMC family oxidoreductase [Geminicoccaceae bacterium]|nr:GMC family oxidoreductase [Geminicoccaceae bacterium]
MRLTLADLGDGADLACDVCVVGAGAAGITLALELKGQGLDVVLLEAGGAEVEDGSQALYAGRAPGLPIELDWARLRCLGGSTNHWGGRSRPFGPEALRPRPWFAPEGWPLAADDLAAPQARALELCEIGLAPGEDWDAPLAKLEARAFAGGRLKPGLWRFSPPTAFGERYGKDLDAAPDVRLVLNAPLVGIDLDGGLGRVVRLRVQNRTGRRATVRPGTVVLAMGGIENPRLLLAQRGQTPDGIGNRHDMVGRCFMGHPVYEPLTVALADGVVPPAFLADRDLPDGRRVEGFLGLTPEAQADLKTGAIDGAFYAGGQFGPPGVKALRRILREVRQGHFPPNLAGEIGTVAGDLGGIAREAMLRLGWQGALNTYTVSILLEQEPNPMSRVRLGDESDALGLPRVVVDWRLSDRDKATVRTYARVLAEEVGRVGLGRAYLEDWASDESLDFPQHGNSAHHMGTTRMGNDPRSSVVDPDCRVHGLDNLYVAGSSVFPASGSVHPTLNLVTLAVRLAGHLKVRLREDRRAASLVGG